VLEGDGAGENFEGIINAGIGAVAGTEATLMEDIFRARTAVRVDGRGRPNAIVMHPEAWEIVRLARENVDTGIQGGYLMGPPSQIGATTVWGIPVVEAEVLDEDIVLVGDFVQGCTLFDREQASVRVGTIDQQFIRNMQTILAELRAAFVVWRPAMFCQVTGL
jgi:HK97 family phage major capsid protein